MVNLDIPANALKDLHTKGYSNSQISKVFNCSAETIRNKLKLLGLGSNQGTTINGVHIKKSSIDPQKFLDLYNQGLSDGAIGKILGYTDKGINSYRLSLGLEHHNLRYAKNSEISSEQEEILIGTMLGDGHLKMPKGTVNASGSIIHGEKQEHYLKWKTNKLIGLCGEPVKNTRRTIDQRTGIYYTSWDLYIYTNPLLNELYNELYSTGKKVITENSLKKYSSLSLAVHFMDDGSKSGNTYSIATQCFDIQSLDIFRTMLFEKFQIDTTLHKSKNLYILTKSSGLFTYLVTPYVNQIECMRYKLQTVSLNPVKRGIPTVK